MWPTIVKVSAIAAIPKLIDTIGDFFNSLFQFDEDEQKQKQLGADRHNHHRGQDRKIRDNTPMTKHMANYIVYEHAKWLHLQRTDPSKCGTVIELVALMNKRMGTDKSHSVFHKIWTGNRDIATLIDGPEYFDYEG